MLAKQLASEWAKYNIGLKAIVFAFIRTGLSTPYLHDKVKGFSIDFRISNAI